MVIRETPIVHHGANVRMLVVMGPIVVAISVQNDAQPAKVVLIPKDRAIGKPVARVPQRKAVAIQLLAFPVHLEAHYNVPVARINGLQKKTFT